MKMILIELQPELLMDFLRKSIQNLVYSRLSAPLSWLQHYQALRVLEVCALRKVYSKDAQRKDCAKARAHGVKVAATSELLPVNRLLNFFWEISPIFCCNKTDLSGLRPGCAKEKQFLGLAFREATQGCLSHFPISLCFWWDLACLSYTLRESFLLWEDFDTSNFIAARLRAKITQSFETYH